MAVYETWRSMRRPCDVQSSFITITLNCLFRGMNLRLDVSHLKFVYLFTFRATVIKRMLDQMDQVTVSRVNPESKGWIILYFVMYQRLPFFRTVNIP